MRSLTVAVIAAAGVMAAAIGPGASAAPSAGLMVQPAKAASVKLVQYHRYHHRPYWGHPYWGYPPHHHYWRPWWRYSQAEQLNRQELRNLGAAP